jgi:protein ImuB
MRAVSDPGVAPGAPHAHRRGRIACVDLPALPLQLVWRQRPQWRAHPVVVIEEDRPQGVVLWACERARAQRVLPGQRFGQALSLCSGLRAQVVEPEVISAAVEELLVALSRVSPRVEANGSGGGGAAVMSGAASGNSAGTFWLDGEGLERLYGSEASEVSEASEASEVDDHGARWGTAILQEILRCGYSGVVVVGFARFASYAIARTRPARPRQLGRVLVLPSEEAERIAAAQVPLARLEIDAKLLAAMARLGVTTLGQLVALPGGGLLERFGGEAHRLHQLAAGARWDPIAPVSPPQPLEERVLLDDEEHHVEGLVFVIKGALDRLLQRMAARHRALTALHLELRLRHRVHELETRVDCLKPAAPTLDARALLRLVHLRLEHQPPAAGVIEVKVGADDAPATREQLALFAEKPRRDLRAADQALAALRAELGEDAVVTPRLREGHLPEARFGWQRLTHLPAAAPRPAAELQLVRRIFARPRPLPAQLTNLRDDGWMLSGSADLGHGSVVRVHGPFVVSGGWWASEVQREYHFAETQSGACLWVYYDRVRRRWFWQGEVE